MDNAHKLKRGGGKLPKSREGAPQVRCVYRQDKLLTPEVISPAVRLRRESQHADGGAYRELITCFSSLSTHDPNANDKDNGQRTNILLKTNLSELDYPEDLVLYDYRINVEPDIRNVDKDLRLSLFVLFESSRDIAPFVGGIVHDGVQRLISDRPLPEGLTVTVPYFVDEGGLQADSVIYMYVFQLLGPKELRAEDLTRYLDGNNPSYSTQPIVSAFNLILSSLVYHTGARTQRRGFHFFPIISVPSDITVPLGANLEVWRGLSFTATPFRKGLMVSTNVGISAFYVPYRRLSDAMLDYAKMIGGVDVTSFYHNISITTTYLGYCRKRKIKAFGPASARRTLIYVESLGGELTVEHYFKQVHGISLEHADDLPVVNIGTGEEDLYVPPEICGINPGQNYPGPLPGCAKLAIEQASIKNMNTEEESFDIRYVNQRLANFGLTINSNRELVPARVLPPPQLFCSSTGDVSWTVQSARFLRPAQLRNLAIFVIREDNSGDIIELEHRLRVTIMNLLAKCRSFGMQLDTNLPALDVLTIPQETPKDPLRKEALDSIESKLLSVAAGKDLVLAFLPRKDAHIHGSVKSTCNVKLGIHCLCAISANFINSRSQDAHISTLTMKMNTLLGGVNRALDTSSIKWLEKTMLVGVSVSRLPSEFFPVSLSVAAVTASYDKSFVHYPASVNIQECVTGMVTDMKQMIKERLEKYRRQMNSLPMRIIVFRGGISDSQIRDLVHSEVEPIRDAFKSFGDYEPTLTFMVCTKPHRIRFYPAETKSAKVANPTTIAAGTVIDGELDTPHKRDFYVHAHTASQREARATRYTIIHDDNKFNIGALQSIVNDVSYLHPISPRSISLPPPLHWARRANRAACIHLRSMLSSLNHEESDDTSEKQIVGKLKEAWGKGMHGRITKDMFYL